MVAIAHEVVIRGPKFLGAEAGPVLLERTDARFMSNVRDELTRPVDQSGLKQTIVKQTGETLRLFQPIHRTFYVALAELVCNIPGTPRLDPARIDSAGLVVRRVRTIRGGQQVSVYEGWMQAQDGTSGWVTLSKPSVSKGEIGMDEDPDAARRRARSSGNSELDVRLAALRARTSTLSESVTDLFVLPPKVTASTHATLLFGLLPTTSLATSKPPPAPPFDDDEDLDIHPFFTAGQSLAIPKTTVASDGTISLARPTTIPSATSTLGKYIAFVQQVVIQYDLLGESPAAQNLKRLLNEIQLPFSTEPKQRPLGDHIVAAAKVLVFPPIVKTAEEKKTETEAERIAREQTERVEMPSGWFAALGNAELKAIRDGIGDSMRKRLDALNREEPQFGKTGDLYEARAFVRVRRDDGCPPDLVWTQKATPAFEIAPWFESGPGPIPVVELPDPFAGLARFKPNVAFALPPSIVDVVRNNSADDLIKGAGKRGASIGLGWLCSFNIPLITLCAFIVLSIFLSLFQIIFWWLAFIKICIPIPKRRS